MAESCKKYDLKLGLYYSRVIDWHEKYTGYFKNKETRSSGSSCFNNWYYQAEERNYDIVFNEKMLPQVEELLTNYGHIFLMWFDMPLESDRKYSKAFFNLVKKLQPNCLINSRLSNGMYDYISLGDNCIPKEGENLVYDSNELRDENRNLYNPYNLFESACTLNDTYGYSAIDNN